MSQVTFLHAYLDRKDTWSAEEIKGILERNPLQVNEVNHSSITPLLRVLYSHKCSIDVIKVLLDYGASVNSRQYYRSPLTIAVFFFRGEVVIRALLEKGANVQVKDYLGRTILCDALGFCTKATVKLLLDAGCDPNACEVHSSAFGCIFKYDFSVLYDEGILELLISAGVTVNALDNQGRTPLRTVVESNCRIDSIQLLLSSGARIGFSNGDASLLQLGFDQHRRENSQYTLDILKLLVKYYFFENPEFELRSLTEGQIITGTLANELEVLADKLAREVIIMKSAYIDDQSTLFDFIRKRSYSKMIAARKSPSVSPDYFNDLLRLLFDKDFCHFFTDITTMVGKSAMDVKLQELQVYTAKTSSVSSHTNEKVILNYDSVSEIAQYLTPPEVMNLILSFYDPKNQIVNDETPGISIKRKPEEYDKRDKRFKLIV